MTWHSSCVVYEGICPFCGERITGGSDNGTLDVPREGQVAVCLLCRLLGRDRDGEVQAPTPSAALFSARRGS